MHGKHVISVRHLSMRIKSGIFHQRLTPTA